MAKRLSDFDKNLKPRHIGDKAVTLTISHVGIKQKPRQEQERVITLAGEMPEERNYDEQLVLYFAELGSTKALNVNNTNREVLITAVGDDPKSLIGRRVVLQVQEKAFFGRKRPMVTITNVLARDAKKAPTESGVVNTETGEIEEPVKDEATLYWNEVARVGLARKEASDIIKRNTKDTTTGKVIDWQNAHAELHALAMPADMPA